MFDDARWGDDPRDRRDDDGRDRDDEDALALGRGPGSTGPREDHSEDDPSKRDDGSRGLERDRDSRDRDGGLDPRDVFMRDLDLPRGPDREIVHDARDREYTLRGSETRTLSTVGAFRVVRGCPLTTNHPIKTALIVLCGLLFFSWLGLITQRSRVQIPPPQIPSF